MFLLDDILLAPIKGVTWVSEKIGDVAHKEFFDPDKIHEEMMTLEAKLDLGEMTEEEYRMREKDLLERLGALRKEEE